MDKFITEDMFISLTGCITMVCCIVQLLKNYIPINPIWINLIVSAIITVIRIVLVGDFSFSGIVLGALNLILILFGAGGRYDIGKGAVNGIMAQI